MAKLAKLMNENIQLKKDIQTCTEAYRELLQKHRKHMIKYSYEDTMEEVKRIDKDRNINKKLLL